MSGNAQQAQIVSQATMEAMEAKQRFETEQAQRNVRLLSEQVEERLSGLIRRAEEIRTRVANATYEGRSAGYSKGAFGSDTDTIDALLVALAEEADRLENMVAATAAGVEIRDRFTAQLEEMQGAAQPGPQPEGQPFAMPAGGAYL